MKNTRAYLDIVIGNKAIGRVVFELFVDITPKTSENFRGLCTGEYGYGKVYKKKLSYLGSRFHRIVEDQFVQGGDFVFGNGTGGESIYGEVFKDENFQRRHACAGLLSMANKGRNSNSSQFFITLKPCPHLDGNHVVFGQVIEGMEVIRQIGKVPTDLLERPKIKISIFSCGDFDSKRLHITEDPFKDAMKLILADRQITEKVKELGPDQADLFKNMKKKSAFDVIQTYADEESDPNEENEEEDSVKGEGDNKKTNEEIEDEEEEERNENLENMIQNKLGNSATQRFLDLKMKINEVKNLNNKAVLDENRRSNDPEYEKSIQKKEFAKKHEDLKVNLALQGIPEDKSYILDSINKCDQYKNKDKKKKRTTAFGWDVFNEDALYRAYKKRLKRMPFDKTSYDEQVQTLQAAGTTDIALPTLTTEKKTLLEVDLDKQIKSRDTYSRRRAFYEDKDVDYINERNRVFNSKLSRYFEKDAAEIKANLERGTAL